MAARGFRHNPPSRHSSNRDCQSEFAGADPDNLQHWLNVAVILVAKLAPDFVCIGFRRGSGRGDEANTAEPMS